jgi:Uma2 family endonuclease
VDISALDSVPQPDLAWLKRKDYRHGRPTPEDVLLLIEVSDSSLRYDREVKGPLYAQAGIQEYWIVNVPEETIEVYRQPHGARYGSVTTLRRGDVARSLAFPDVALALHEFFGGPA